MFSNSKWSPLSLMLVALAAGTLLAGCSDRVSVEQLKSWPKYDAHTHIRGAADYIWNVQDEYNMGFLTICTGGLREEGLVRQIDAAMELSKDYPDRIYWATSFDLVHRYEKGWTEKVLAGIQDGFDHGAVAVKVWKDIGMEITDSDGNYTQIDDPMFEPILNYIEKKDKTLVAHIGEPLNSWLPLEKMTVNNDRNYFKQNPQYHSYLHPEIPHHSVITAARDRMLAAHPNLRVVGCHLGSYEYDVDVLAECFDKYPNFAVDTSARICHFQVQDREKVRNFIIKYQDRILYGTDIAAGPVKPEQVEERRKRLEAIFDRDMEYFATDNEMTVPEVNGSFNGLALPKVVLKKLFHDNAVKWYPGM
jgi:predicted TIM-barrel fold metal-dependent hydrolase